MLRFICRGTISALPDELASRILMSSSQLFAGQRRDGPGCRVLGRGRFASLGEPASRATLLGSYGSASKSSPGVRSRTYVPLSCQVEPAAFDCILDAGAELGPASLERGEEGVVDLLDVD